MPAGVPASDQEESSPDGLFTLCAATTESVSLSMRVWLPVNYLKIVNINTHANPNKADQRKSSKTARYGSQQRSLKRRDSCRCVVVCSESRYR
ncbi:hypothetical protein ATANTOWER_027356 [Ataeniobius toweri]|uniref:Uncharacterized protein n=1 Tax=Ataeniobius toweri TaxID=208326 RepID=A0ABU7BCV3_9TELE|nr:hypothetical protein [Ataeniobius toweri]